MIWAGFLALPVVIIKPIITSDFINVASSNGGIFLFFLERMILGFSFGALASAVYESFFHLRVTKNKHPEREKLLFLLVGILVALISFTILQLPFSSSIILGLGANILIVLILRPDLLWDMIFSGFFMGALYFFVYLITSRNVPGDTTRLWFSDNTLGITFFSLPIEEIISVILFGAFWGPLYVAVKDLREKRGRQN